MRLQPYQTKPQPARVNHNCFSSSPPTRSHNPHESCYHNCFSSSPTNTKPQPARVIMFHNIKQACFLLDPLGTSKYNAADTRLPRFRHQSSKQVLPRCSHVAVPLFQHPCHHAGDFAGYFEAPEINEKIFRIIPGTRRIYVKNCPNSDQGLRDS